MILGNIWKKFVALIPTSTKYVGTIVTVINDGFYTVSLVGGGTLQVTGPVGLSISDRVFITDKKIDGPAPSLTTLTIEV